MSKLAISGVAAGLIGGAMLLSGFTPATAATLPNLGLSASGETALVEQVARRDRDRSSRYERRRDRISSRDRDRRYDRSRHGSRYSYARPGFRHHYGGYYYSSPWWIGPSIGFALTVPSYGGGYGGNAHVEWCLNRYRSYDPGSDTFLGYDGYRHRCNSPF
jgi:hypothetical protein